MHIEQLFIVNPGLQTDKIEIAVSPLSSSPKQSAEQYPSSENKPSPAHPSSPLIPAANNAPVRLPNIFSSSPISLLPSSSPTKGTLVHVAKNPFLPATPRSFHYENSSWATNNLVRSPGREPGTVLNGAMSNKRRVEGTEAIGTPNERKRRKLDIAPTRAISPVRPSQRSVMGSASLQTQVPSSPVKQAVVAPPGSPVRVARFPARSEVAVMNFRPKAKLPATSLSRPATSSPIRPAPVRRTAPPPSPSPRSHPISAVRLGKRPAPHPSPSKLFLRAVSSPERPVAAVSNLVSRSPVVNENLSPARTIGSSSHRPGQGSSSRGRVVAPSINRSPARPPWSSSTSGKREPPASRASGLPVPRSTVVESRLPRPAMKPGQMDRKPFMFGVGTTSTFGAVSTNVFMANVPAVTMSGSPSKVYSGVCGLCPASLLLTAYYRGSCHCYLIPRANR